MRFPRLWRARTRFQALYHASPLVSDIGHGTVAKSASRCLRRSRWRWGRRVCLGKSHDSIPAHHSPPARNLSSQLIESAWCFRYSNCRSTHSGSKSPERCAYQAFLLPNPRLLLTDPFQMRDHHPKSHVHFFCWQVFPPLREESLSWRVCGALHVWQGTFWGKSALRAKLTVPRNSWVALSPVTTPGPFELAAVAPCPPSHSTLKPPTSCLDSWFCRCRAGRAPLYPWTSDETDAHFCAHFPRLRYGSGFETESRTAIA